MTEQTYPTAFLDRDGTINIDWGYVIEPEKIALLEGAADAIALLKANGFKTAIISNQSAVGRGMAQEEDIDKCNQALIDLLLKENKEAVIDAVLYSSDHPERASDRRKPGTGLLRELPWSYNPQESWMFGDKTSDVEFGRNAGLPARHCVLIAEEPGASESLLSAVRTLVIS